MSSQLILHAVSGATTVGSVIGMPTALFYPGIFGFSLQQKYGATSSGAWTFEITLDPTALTDAASAAWDDETAAFALTDPTAVGAAIEILQYEGKFLAMRPTYTKTAGTDDVYLWLMR
jgi:hypothetical protein